MANHIVLEASGKDWDIFSVTVKIFSNKKEAQEYCKQNSKRDKDDQRFWTKAEIKKDGESFDFV
ncbi:hypothetical protein ACE193_21720 [Bernardetia sp. OM2101]|uniref:hypothetical protein n=1 Tax=Bernardetia sp. OM2101 TaxID=3344876 RepID=UPI0035D0E837